MSDSTEKLEAAEEAAFQAGREGMHDKLRHAEADAASWKILAKRCNEVRDRQSALIAQLVEALELAKGYVEKTEGVIPVQPNLVTPDREKIDAALSAAKAEAKP